MGVLDVPGELSEIKMKAAKQLRKPEHWQGFERLAQKLWGEVWNCRHTIKRHGRNGQAQCGVDVYGIAKGETSYWGVQCKGKDEYTHAQLTIKQVDDEIAEAEAFKPSLGMYIIATTANRNAAIQEHVRIRNAERISKGLFGVDVCAWEDIVELLEEHPEALSWYLGAANISDSHDANISFTNGESCCVVHPEYLRKTKRYQLRPTELSALLASSGSSISPFRTPEFLASIRSPLYGGGPVNHAWCKLEFVIVNSGSRVIEDWRLDLYVEDGVCEKLSDGDSLAMSIDRNWASWKTVFVYEEDSHIAYRPLDEQPLVQKASRVFEAHILPKRGIDKIRISYQLLARDYSKDGELEIAVEPEYEERIETVFVDEEPVPEDQVFIQNKLT